MSTLLRLIGRRLGALPAGGLGCCPLVARVAPGRGLFCYSFWDAASTSAI